MLSRRSRHAVNADEKHYGNQVASLTESILVSAEPANGLPLPCAHKKSPSAPPSRPPSGSNQRRSPAVAKINPQKGVPYTMMCPKTSKGRRGKKSPLIRWGLAGQMLGACPTLNIVFRSRDTLK